MLKKYSQKDPRWKNILVGFGAKTIGQAGCYLCSPSMIAEIPPDKANELLKKNGGYSGNLIKSAEAAEALGLEYGGKVYSNNKFPCVMETDHYKSQGVPQHFVVMTDASHILDPLDYPVEEKKNKYNIISYRLFNKKNMEKEYHIKSVLKNAIEKITGKDYGSEMNEKEQEEATEDLKNYQAKCEDYIQDFESVVDDLRNCQIDRENLIDKLKQSNTTVSGYVKKAQELNAELVKKNEEIKTLKENNPAYNLLHRLKQAVLDLINFR